MGMLYRQATGLQARARASVMTANAMTTLYVSFGQQPGTRKQPAPPTTAPALSSGRSGVSLQGHWDCDQELGRFEGKTACPILSVIVYASSAGGPTLVLDQRPDDAWGETVRGGLVWPHAGAVAVFPGNLLNSVCGLPGEPTRFSGAAGSGAGQAAGVRETVLLNLWAACPLDLPHCRQSSHHGSLRQCR